MRAGPVSSVAQVQYARPMPKLREESDRLRAQSDKLRAELEALLEQARKLRKRIDEHDRLIAKRSASAPED